MQVTLEFPLFLTQYMAACLHRNLFDSCIPSEGPSTQLLFSACLSEKMVLTPWLDVDEENIHFSQYTINSNSDPKQAQLNH